jgi:hypothetical protein
MTTDLPTVWDAPSSEMRIKQRIVRLLIQEIIVDADEPTRRIVLVIHWAGGLGRVVLCFGLAAGCAASSETKASPAAAPPPAAQASAPQPVAPAAQPAPSPGDVTLREEKDLGQVWLAPGFALNGYDALLIAEPRAEVPKLNPDGIANLEWARGVVRSELASAIEARKLFTVVQSPGDVKAGSRLGRHDSTIIEYEKGGGGARMFGFASSAGQPVIKIRGQLTADGRPLFVYGARRSGVSASARMFGGYRSDEDIQEEDIKHLAKGLGGLGDFMVKTKGQ